MKMRNLFFYLLLLFLSTNALKAQIDSLFINGSDTNFTMVSGDAVSWQMKVPNGATVSLNFWLDTNGDGIVDTSVDVKRFEFTTTDGPSSGGLPDLDGTVNGRIYFSQRVGLAPGNYVFLFGNNGDTISRRGTVTPILFPAHAISGHVTPPEGKSPRYLFMEAKRSGNAVLPKSWEGYTDSLGDYVIYTDADTTGNPWEVVFVNGGNPYYPAVYTPSLYSFTLIGNPSGLNFTFVDFAAKISGTLKDEEGNPIAFRGVSIMKESGSSNFYRSVVTDGSGFFEIGLAPDELWDSTFRLASYFINNTDNDMIAVRKIHGIHGGDSLFFNLVTYHVNSSIQGKVFVNGHSPGFPVRIAGNVLNTAYTFTMADSITGNFSLPVSNHLTDYEVGPDNLVGIYMWNNVFAHPGDTGIIINLTGDELFPQYSININAMNGTVARNPNQAFYDSNSVVELTASPNHGYKFTGWSGDASGMSNPITIIMSNNKNIMATFMQDSSYLVRYRTFNPDSIALTKDNFGKVGKSVKRKPTSAQFIALIDSRSDGNNGLHIEFGSAIDTTFDFYTEPVSTKSEVPKSKLAKWNLTFSSLLNSGDTVKIYGRSSKGVLQKISSYWWTKDGMIVGKKQKNPVFAENILRLPMPNHINVLEEAFSDGFSSGMMIGVDYANKDSAKKYGWVHLKKAADAMKSLSVTSKGVVNLHDGTARAFDYLVAGKNMKNFVGKQMSLPPTKQDNVLFANLVALKTSITASSLGITPRGFGDLILSDTATNLWNGMTLLQFSAKADTMISGYANHTFETAQTYEKLSNTIRNILNAFEGPTDTNSFGDSLVLQGVRQLIDCEILSPHSSNIPYRIIPEGRGREVPQQFVLYQNYPNPFNPATVIRYSLPVHGTVTLKIYNLLGQEVVTLLNSENMDEGDYEIPFDGSGLSSGVYFYRINIVGEDGAISFTDVKRMLMIK